jgi:probable HAF family extracellular repeat protein
MGTTSLGACNKVGRAAVLVGVLLVVVLGGLIGRAHAAPVFTAIELGTFGGPYGEAVAVNAGGQVVGWAWTADRAQHAFSWTQARGIVDLGTLDGFVQSAAAAVSDSGQVVGSAYTGEYEVERAFSWTEAGGMVDLGTLGGAHSRAVAVNESGQVVGRSTIADGSEHAFSWTEAGGMVDLGTLGGSLSRSVAVNESGQVVGHSLTVDGYIRGFSWTQAGGMVDVGTLDGFAHSSAEAVSDAGQIVGSAETAGLEVRHAISWTPTGGMVDLGTLGGTSSKAIAVNENGQVVGSAETGRGFEHAFSWTPTGGMVDLGTLGGRWSEAVAVNDSGQVVGDAQIDDASPPHAFSWTEADGMFDLGTLSGDQSYAAALNGAGQVVGWAETASGETRAVLWSPVTESIPNAGVEEDPAGEFFYRPDEVGFKGTAEVRFAWSSEYAHTGARSLKMTGRSTSSAGRWMTETTAIPVTQGESYEACAWFRLALGEAGRARLAVSYWNKRPRKQAVNIPQTRLTEPLSGEIGWTRLCLTGTAPAGADHLRVEGRFSGKGSVWLDDFSVVPLGP